MKLHCGNCGHRQAEHQGDGCIACPKGLCWAKPDSLWFAPIEVDESASTNTARVAALEAVAEAARKLTAWEGRVDVNQQPFALSVFDTLGRALDALDKEEK